MVRAHSVIEGVNIHRGGPDTERLAEQYLRNDDFFYVRSGEVTFTIGGRAAGPVSAGSDLADPTITSPGIIGGEIRTLKRGEGVHIPAGVWHQWGTQDVLYMMVFKIPAAEGEVEPQP